MEATAISARPIPILISESVAGSDQEHSPCVLKGILRTLAGTRLSAALRQEVESGSFGEASLSYAHQNHFDKVVLGSSMGWKLVAHFWDSPPNSKALIEDRYDIHNHRWPFASLVLEGSLSIDHYRHANSPHAYLRHRYESPSGRPDFTLEIVGPAQLRHEFSGVVMPEQLFGLDEVCLHRAFPKSSSGALSLVLQAPSRKDSTDVFCRIDSPSPGRLPAPQLSEEVLELHMVTLAERLEELSLDAGD